MSYNLDALTEDNGLAEEKPAGSSKRGKKTKKPENDLETRTRNTDKSSATSVGGITNLSLIRHIVFFVLFAAAGVAGFLFREDVMANVGYGALPLGLWGVLFVYLALARTRWVIGRYRETISSLIVVLGGVTVLGIFDAPLGSATGATMGGRFGEILAREPYDWHRYDLVLWQQALAWARAAVFFTVGAAFQFPTAFGMGFKVIWIGTLMAISASISMFMMAGGAASAITSKRHRDKSGVWVKGVDEDDEGDGAPSLPIRALDDITKPKRKESAPVIRGDVFDASDEFVVDIGNTIVVRDEEKFDVDDQMQSDDGWEPVVQGKVARASHSSIATQDDLPEFVAVGDHIGDDDPDEAEFDVFDGDDEFFEAEVGAFAREDRDAVSDNGMSAATEAVLDMITSGAAIEAAMNAFPWRLPPIEDLAVPPKGGVATAEIRATSDLIEETLDDHGIAVTVDQVRVGPTVTMYGLKPGWKGGGTNSKVPRQRVRVDTILNREKDIALALSSPNIRFESVVPGSSVVGIEVPNARPTPVNLRTVMDTPQWAEFAEKAALPVPLGMGSGGDPVMADFAKMPHTLVAGATGSGKSVCMNTIVTGLLMTRTPLELRMVMIDPKRVELTPYQGIPHLYAPVIVEPEQAVKALKGLVKEMMDRFSTLEATGVKNITSYNDKSTFKMPYLLILVDELADLMLTASSEVEQLLVRLAQLGRATGVHLVVATQRPSVDVVTGLIKANFPSRISFAVGSQVDSRTILDATGAERLLGKGDMLYKPIDLSQPVRVQGAFLSEEEIETTVKFWKHVGAPPLPQLGVDEAGDDDGFSMPGFSEENGDALFMQASSMARSQKTLSTSLLQRRLRIGYPRAARLMDELEDAGIVGPGEPGKPRQVIVNLS